MVLEGEVVTYAPFINQRRSERDIPQRGDLEVGVLKAARRSGVLRIARLTRVGPQSPHGVRCRDGHHEGGLG